MKTVHSRATYRGTATALSVVLTLGVAGFTAPAVWAGTHDDDARAAESATAQAAPVAGRGVATPISRATAALTRATRDLQAHRPRAAISELADVRLYVGQAHAGAVHLIGAPPADPESDEPPGPAAVLAVLGLEHRVGIGVVPLFDNRGSAAVVDALRRTLSSTQDRRKAMLARVIALPPEGARDDYEDGMADTLGQYPTEVNQLTKALQTYRLTAAARTGLHNALVRVRATEAMVNTAFGGGERALP